MTSSRVFAVFVAAIVACLSPGAPAAIGNITTVAGGGAGDGGPATNAPLGSTGVAVDSSGNVYIADYYNNRIRKVLPSGVVTTIAGAEGWGFDGDGGPATKALLNWPSDVTLDSSGNVYFLDAGNVRVRKIDLNGVITTVAGNGTTGFSGDGGPATSASFNEPNGIAILSTGELVIADTLNRRVRRVSNGVITTVAGNGDFCAGCIPAEGVAATSGAMHPWGLGSDGAGGFYVTTQSRLRHVNAAGVVTTVAGNGGSCFGGCTLGDGGPALQGTLYFPKAIARDGAGNLYVADSSNGRVRKIASGIISTVAGTGASAVSNGDGGPAVAAAIQRPSGVASDSTGVLYITDVGRIRKVDGAGVITTLAGYGERFTFPSFRGDGLLATDAVLGFEFGGRALTDASGDLRIGKRRVDASTGIIDQDPTGTWAAARDLAGNVYWISNYKVMRTGADGVVTTLAGNGYAGDPAEGAPTLYSRLDPLAVALDSAGTLYIAQGPYRILRIDGEGRVRYIAGNGSDLYSGDGGPAKDAGIFARFMTVDGAGNLYLADRKRVRKIDTAGLIQRIAGNGTSGYGGDGGPAVDAIFGSVNDVAADAAGNVYVMDGPNFRVRRIDLSGKIETVVGNGVQGFGGNGGPALQANLHSATYVSWDPSGFLYVTEDTSIPLPDGIYAARTIPRIRKVSLDDESPEPFTIPAVQGVALSTLVQSSAVTPTGFTSPASVSTLDGEHSVGCTGVFSMSPGTLQPGQSLCVRHTSASVGNQVVRTTLFVGGVRATFQSRTASTPGALSMAPATLAFGNYSMGTESGSRQVTLTNSGASALPVHSVAASPHYRVQHACAILSPGQSCVVSVSFAPLTPGALDASMIVETAAGTYSLLLTGTGEASLVTHYYRGILGREPDAAGKQFWNDEAARMAALGVGRNETWFALATSFFSSAEYAGLARDDAGFVRDLYLTFFNREPDAGGRDYWISQLEGGMPREVLLVSFLFSKEFVDFTSNIFGPDSTRAEVDMVMDFYRGLLARLPDDSGFGQWVQRLRVAQCSRQPFVVRSEVEELSRLFASSSEYAGRARTNAQYVGDLYNAFMRRGGDLAGVTWWIAELDSGRHTREKMRQDFLLSLEFFVRASRVVNEGCLN